MRECFRHKSGKIFLSILAISILGMLIAPFFFAYQGMVLGIIPLPFFVGLVMIIIWFFAYLIYFKKYWPFR
jgi:hypothetical protein